MLKHKINLQLFAVEALKTHQEENFGKLLEPGLRKLFYETYDELPEQFSKVFHVLSSKKSREIDYGVGSMTPWEEFGKADGTAYTSGNMPEVPFETIPAGLERIYKHKEFAKGFIVQRKFVDDEEYGVINKMPKDLARAGRYKVETDAASLFNTAFSAAGYDGKALIAADHPLLNKTVVTEHGTGVCSNLVDAALSDTALKSAFNLGRKQVDEAGKLIQFKYDTLVVPPELEWLANELVKSTHKVGTDYNDVNSLAGRFKVEVWDFLTDKDACFLMDSKRHNLNFFWRVENSLAA